MKKKFNFITSRIGSSWLKTFIEDALGADEVYFKEIRRHLPKNIQVPGFSSVTKVAFHDYRLLVNPIHRAEIHVLKFYGMMMLKGWTLNHTQHFEKVKKCLVELGYSVTDPDFDSGGLAVNSLKLEDIYTDDEKCSYFRPHNGLIDGVNDFEATV